MQHPLRHKLCVALDTDSRDQAEEWIKFLSDYVGVFKVGKELFTAEGPSIIDLILENDAEVFLDLKFHDIPKTVEKACRIVAKKNVSYLTVHASGGRDMLRAAVEGAGSSDLNLLGVTVLTSLSEKTLKNELNVDTSLKNHVIDLAQLCDDAGLAGVVASGEEIEVLRQKCRSDFLIVTPGIRPTGSKSDDQSRIVTPSQAIKSGANLLVVGRPITQASDRFVAAQKILEEIQNA